jgi:hypothetical protein
MSGIGFALATRADEPDLRRLLRDNPVGGGYALGLEREPDAFAADFGLSERHAFIIARRDDTGEAVGMCERLVAPAFVDGKVEHLPYLGALRVAGSHRNRIAILKGGFGALRDQVEQADELPFALTSIAADNDVAQRILTAGLKGLPTYTPVAPYSTLMLRPRAGRVAPEIGPASEADWPALSDFLQAALARYQFAPVWTEARLKRCGPASQFLVFRKNGAILGAVSVWDQRGQKQAVVRGYPKAVVRLRRPLNLIAPLIGLPQFPPIGSVLAQGFLSHLAANDDDPVILRALVRAGLAEAHRRGLSVAVLGCGSGHPLRDLVRKTWRSVEYRTDLYAVHWGDAPVLSDRVAMPEVALL